MYVLRKFPELNSSHIPIGSMYSIYGNMDPINIPPKLAYLSIYIYINISIYIYIYTLSIHIPYMDPLG